VRTLEALKREYDFVALRDAAAVVQREGEL
jgi:hypothetical protein